MCWVVCSVVRLALTSQFWRLQLVRMSFGFNPLPPPGTSRRAPRGHRDRPAAAEPVPRAPRGRTIAPRDRLSPLHIHTSGTFGANLTVVRGKLFATFAE